MLVPDNFPDLLADAGLIVYVMDSWQDIGLNADHKVICLHHTASSANVLPQDDAAYCHHGSDIAPLYNVMVDRYGEVWLISQNCTNNAGQITYLAYQEAAMGVADLTPAGERGFVDDTSQNKHIFAISGQNNGVDEIWSPELTQSMAVVTLVAAQSMGLIIENVTTHRALTRRKIDPCGPNCVDDWHQYLHILKNELDIVPLAGGAVELRTTSDGNGYYVVASDGGVFAFGSAQFFGSLGGEMLNSPIVGMAVVPNDNGYWLVASDGGVFAFGAAHFFGSMGGVAMNAPVVSIESTPTGDGYWLLAQDGGVFAFGGAQFLGTATHYIK